MGIKFVKCNSIVNTYNMLIYSFMNAMYIWIWARWICIRVFEIESNRPKNIWKCSESNNCSIVWRKKMQRECVMRVSVSVFVVFILQQSYKVRNNLIISLKMKNTKNIIFVKRYIIALSCAQHDPSMKRKLWLDMNCLPRWFYILIESSCFIMPTNLAGILHVEGTVYLYSRERILPFVTPRIFNSTWCHSTS